MTNLQIRQTAEAVITPDSIREMRQTMGATLSQFAEIFGVSIGTVHSWERGHTSPRSVSKTILTTFIVAEFNPKVISMADLRTVNVGRSLFQALALCMNVLPVENEAKIKRIKKVG